MPGMQLESKLSGIKANQTRKQRIRKGEALSSASHAAEPLLASVKLH